MLGPAQAQLFLRRLLVSDPKIIPPVCLWGDHGIGKTELVKTIATDLGWAFRSISPAQLEEMGDLLGLPYLDDSSSEKKTRFAPPSWVPTSHEPGILLLDDFNRAEDRIIRGLMPLLQFKEIVGWKLPETWRIILTGNPEQSHYAVTPIDEAVKSRMLHLSLTFDLDSWIDWAKKAELPAQGIAFAKQHPDIFNLPEVSPRSFSYFLKLWKHHGSDRKDQQFVSTLAYSALDQRTAALFIAFLQNDDPNLPPPEALFSDTAEPPLAQWLREMVHLKPQRFDLIQAFCRQLQVHLEKHRNLTSKETQRLQAFLLQDQFPADLRLLFLRQLSDQDHPSLEKLLQNRVLSALLLS